MSTNPLPPPSKKAKSFAFSQGIKNIQKILECPICLSIPKNPDQVHFCSNGHLICHDCHGKVKECPVCRSKKLNGQNPLLKQILSELPKICPHQGCEEEDIPSSDHRKICGYRPIDCLAHSRTTCMEKVVPYNSLVKHLEEKHNSVNNGTKFVGYYGIQVKERDFSLDFLSWNPTISVFEGHTLFLRCIMEKNLFIIQCFILGTDSEAKKYSCEIKVSGKSKPEYKLVTPCEIISVDDTRKATYEKDDFKGNIALSKNIIQGMWTKNDNEYDVLIIQATFKKIQNTGE